MKLRIAQIRIVPEKGNLEGNFATLSAVLKAVAAYKPDVVVTPECYLDGYISTEKSVTRENITEFAIDPATSPYRRELSEWSVDNAAWFIFGCTTTGEAGPQNSALVLNRQGDLVGIYSKTHCQNHDKKYTPGSSLDVFDSDFGSFGVMICADRRWPETVRTLAVQGARVIFNPTYGMWGDLNLAMMRTRSYESEVFIAFTHPRQSLVTGPNKGEVITKDERTDTGFAVTDLDLNEVDGIRSANTSAHLKDRRVDIYRC